MAARTLRDEVRLWIVNLAVGRGRAGHVEVAQAHAAEPVRGRVPAQRSLEGPLGLAIRVDRREGGILADRHHGRDAIDGGRRADDEASHAGFAKGLEEGHATGDVLAVIDGGVGDGLPDQRPGRAVQDGVDRRRLEQGPHAGRVAVAALDEADARDDRSAVAHAQVVEDNHVVAGGDERLDGDGSHVAGSAGDEHAHHGLLSRRRRSPWRDGAGLEVAGRVGATTGGRPVVAGPGAAGALGSPPGSALLRGLGALDGLGAAAGLGAAGVVGWADDPASGSDTTAAVAPGVDPDCAAEAAR